MPTTTTTTTTTVTNAEGTTTKTVTTTTTSLAPTASASTSAAAREALLREQYPKCKDDITAAWLGALLGGADVADFELKLLETGVVSDACIVSLRYGAASEPGARSPASIVLKYSKADELTRSAAVEANMYEKERECSNGLPQPPRQ